VLLSYSSKHFSFVIGADLFNWMRKEVFYVMINLLFCYTARAVLCLLDKIKNIFFCFVFILCHQQGLALWVAIFH